MKSWTIEAQDRVPAFYFTSSLPTAGVFGFCDARGCPLLRASVPDLLHATIAGTNDDHYLSIDEQHGEMGAG